MIPAMCGFQGGQKAACRLPTLPAPAASFRTASRRPGGMPPTATVSTRRCFSAAVADSCRSGCALPRCCFAGRCAAGFCCGGCAAAGVSAAAAAGLAGAFFGAFLASPGASCSSALRFRSASGGRAAAKSTCIVRMRQLAIQLVSV